jgi:hypothetical protein
MKNFCFCILCFVLFLAFYVLGHLFAFSLYRIHNSRHGKIFASEVGENAQQRKTLSNKISDI